MHIIYLVQNWKHFVEFRLILLFKWQRKLNWKLKYFSLVFPTRPTVCTVELFYFDWKNIRTVFVNYLAWAVTTECMCVLNLYRVLIKCQHWQLCHLCLYWFRYTNAHTFLLVQLIKPGNLMPKNSKNFNRILRSNYFIVVNFIFSIIIYSASNTDWQFNF